MKIICAKDYSDLSRKAANIISAQVILKPESVLGLATGSSPLGVYRQLILWYEKGDLDFAEATSVNLDEYRGLSANNTQSYHYFMHKNFFDYINIAPDHIHIPDGMAADPDAECRRYDRLIADLGGIDLQHHRREHPLLRAGGGRSPASHLHGDASHYPSQKDPSDRQRCR